MPRTRGQCKSETCGAPLIWACKPDGGGVPLDPEPTDDGNIVIEDYADDGRPIVRYLKKNEPVPLGAVAYTSHFATCPDADSFRRPKAAR